MILVFIFHNVWLFLFIEVRDNLEESILSFHQGDFGGSNSGHQAWQQCRDSLNHFTGPGTDTLKCYCVPGLVLGTGNKSEKTILVTQRITADKTVWRRGWAGNALMDASLGTQRYYNWSWRAQENSQQPRDADVRPKGPLETMRSGKLLKVEKVPSEQSRGLIRLHGDGRRGLYC